MFEIGDFSEVTIMENNKDTVTLNDELLDKTSGSWVGEYRFIDTYNCPYCTATNYIKRYCYSGQTTWNCLRCGDQFTICF